MYPCNHETDVSRIPVSLYVYLLSFSVFYSLVLIRCEQRSGWTPEAWDQEALEACWNAGCLSSPNQNDVNIGEPLKMGLIWAMVNHVNIEISENLDWHFKAFPAISPVEVAIATIPEGKGWELANGLGFSFKKYHDVCKLLMMREPITYPKLQIATLLPSSAKKRSKHISTKSSPFFGSPFVGWSKLQPCSRPEVPLQECGFTLDESCTWWKKAIPGKVVAVATKDLTHGCYQIAPWSTYK